MQDDSARYQHRPEQPTGDWPDLAGRLVQAEGGGGQRHVLPVRVYFEDTDFSGVVYHASYLRWCERGRSDFLRLLGNDHKALIAGEGGGEPAAFVVRRMNLEYLQPARIDDILIVETMVASLGPATLELDHSIRRGDRKIFEARVLVVLVSQSGKPMRLSKVLRTALDGSSGPSKAGDSGR